ncbi:MAG TPA: glutathione S-transferase family protein [Hyphomonadaceae bacterium]|nr:glutathione S-transferase family protein [Hyphomonadaceae bacterium]
MTPPAPSRHISPLSPRKAPGALRLYYDPASTTCRPIILFASETGIPLDYQLVDLFSDENRSEAYTRLNPNQAVPVLEHDGFVLTESSAILKYLADLTDSPAYPKELKARARVNEVMDFFNTYLMRDYVYGLVYSRVLAHYRLPGGAQKQFIGLHEPRAAKRLKALDAWIGAKQFICGNTITIADYFGSGIISAGELVGLDLRAYPGVARWMNTMKALPTWDEVHAGFYGWRSAVEAQNKASA